MMRSPVFGNELFDQWLNQKTNEILAKVEKEKISTEDMLILSLKAQVNHFHHMDIEFRDEFKGVRTENREMKSEFREEFRSVREEFKAVRNEAEATKSEFREEFRSVREEFEAVRKEMDQRFEQVDARFDRTTNLMLWGFGLVLSSLLAMSLKAYL